MTELSIIMNKIDEFFANNQGGEAEMLMREGIEQALREQDDNALLPLLNELIGYYRETSRVEESFALADQARMLVERMGLEGTIPYATTYLNIANAYRAGGRLSDSLDCYRVTEAVYHKLLDPRDMLEASLQNNMSLLYQEMGDFGSARDCLLKALQIVEGKPDAYFETAVTYANLAATCLNRNEDEEAAGYFGKAIAIFEAHGIEDAHYSAALSSLGTYYFKAGNFDAAAVNYRKAMECMRRSLGENEYYHRLEENLRVCEKALEGKNKSGNGGEVFLSGLELSKAYYEAYGRKMIHEKFAQYEDRIAVGLVGEGSDCFGFDDRISRDHDWGPDFCMWVTSRTYEAVGSRLQEEYEKLPAEFMGYARTVSRHGTGRRGVLVIEDFFSGLLGEKMGQAILVRYGKKRETPESMIRMGEEERAAWQQVPDSALAACVNGEVFRDEEGIFTGIREGLKKGYPESILYLKLAQSAAGFSQAGQYNYGRMLDRKDRVSAKLMLSDCMREAMKLCYYMENCYPPHDKWLFQGLQKGNAANRKICGLLGELTERAASVSGVGEEGKDAVPGTGKEARGDKLTVTGLVEEIASCLAHRLYEKGYSSDIQPYLDAHTGEFLVKSALADKDKEELVEKIAKLEFQAFDKVRNEGGRASCQDDWHTFSIMRKSQYQTWSRPMLLQYLYDFQRELDRGHNLIEEKYGRMMAGTAPGEYEKIKDHFPVLSQEKQAIIEAVVGIVVSWMEEFEKEYPALAGNARSVRTSQDSFYNTSYETYLRGEISTYSDKMLELYGRYVADCAKRGVSLTCEIMTNSVHMYGYSCLKDAEERLASSR